MGLDYSQRRLVGAPIKHHGKRGRRLQMYAFFTGLASTIISLALIIIEVLHK